ncbi:MAG: hypothetical protein Q9167_001302 [Letrouitia subvulpina]
MPATPNDPAERNLTPDQPSSVPMSCLTASSSSSGRSPSGRSPSSHLAGSIWLESGYAKVKPTSDRTRK